MRALTNAFAAGVKGRSFRDASPMVRFKGRTAKAHSHQRPARRHHGLRHDGRRHPGRRQSQGAVHLQALHGHDRDESGPATGRQGGLPKVVAVFEHDERNLLELDHLHRPPAGQRVVPIHRQHQLLFHQGGGFDPRLGDGEDHHREIHLASLQLLHQALGAGLLNRQLEPRVVGVEPGQHGRQEVGGQAGGGPEDQPAAVEAEKVSDRTRSRFAVGKDLPSPRQEDLARAGQPDLVAIPVEQ